MEETLLKRLDKALYTLTASSGGTLRAPTGPRCTDEDVLKAMLAAAE